MKGFVRATAGLALAAPLMATVMYGQAPATPATNDAPVFDVVSVKQNTQGPGGPMMISIQPGGRFIATNLPLANLITQAYRLQSFQLVGAPSWVSTDRFDIQAKGNVELPPRPDPSPNAPPGPLQLMLRAMLADRFKLKTHTESRDSQTYELVLARSDKKLGPKLTPSSVDCVAEQAAARARGDAPVFPAAGEPMRCGARMMPGNLSAGSIQIAQFAAQLAGLVGKPVADRTGLTGNYDVNLTFTPDRLPTRPAGTPDDQPIRINGIEIDPNGPTIFTALQEQLGLKLESVKSSIDVLVVDGVEHPTED